MSPPAHEAGPAGPAPTIDTLPSDSNTDNGSSPHDQELAEVLADYAAAATNPRHIAARADADAKGWWIALDDPRLPTVATVEAYIDEHGNANNEERLQIFEIHAVEWFTHIAPMIHRRTEPGEERERFLDEFMAVMELVFRRNFHTLAHLRGHHQLTRGGADG